MPAPESAPKPAASKRLVDAKTMQQILGLCWTSQSFEDEFVRDPAKVLATYGVSIPPGITIRILRDSATEKNLVLGKLDPPPTEIPKINEQSSLGDVYHHLVVRALLDADFKKKLLADPTAMLYRLMPKLAKGFVFKIFENTETERFFSIPARKGRWERNPADGSQIGQGGFKITPRGRWLF